MTDTEYNAIIGLLQAQRNAALDTIAKLVGEKAVLEETYQAGINQLKLELAALIPAEEKQNGDTQGA